MELELLLSAGLIFILRVINYSISTMRLVFIASNRRRPASMLAFFEAFIFAVVMAGVLNDLTNVLNLAAYCLGASAGSYIGMTLESRFIISYSTLNIITSGAAQRIADSLREHDFGATITHGEGRDGQVDIVRSSATNRDIPTAIRLVRDIAPDAFISVEPARSIQRGWIPGGPPQKRLP